MKPTLLTLLPTPAHCLSIRKDCTLHFTNHWHHHNELELVHFKKCEGTQFIGDRIKHFKSGDMVLVGKQLPHYWHFDNSYFKNAPKHSTDVRIVHFCEDFLGDNFLKLQENKEIKLVLENAKRGIVITGKAKHTVAGLMEKMLNTEGPKRTILLLEILMTIAACNQLMLLTSENFKPKPVNGYNNRIDAIYEYSLANFKNKINLDELAAIANISPGSFSRYFKAQTSKNYSQFLLRLKVEQACKLLVENEMMIIKDICYGSGFNNFDSFYKYFKMITGKTPLKYQKESIKINGSLLVYQ